MAEPVAPWKVLERSTLHDCRIFELQAVHARSPHTQEEHTFYRIESVDWVNVIPVTPEGEIVMVRQYRHGGDETTLEIPGGMVDRGEDPCEAAARELLEETGYRAASLEPIGSVNPNPALFGNRLWTYLAHDARVVAPVRNEGAEYTVVECVGADAVSQLMRDGVIDHALVVAAFHWYDLHGRSQA